MKKPSRKLLLDRETVRRLDEKELERAVGGLITYKWDCSTNRESHCPCNSDMVGTDVPYNSYGSVCWG